MFRKNVKKQALSLRESVCTGCRRAVSGRLFSRGRMRDASGAKSKGSVRAEKRLQPPAENALRRAALRVIEYDRMQDVRKR